jgi:hypothetical protein
VDVLEDGFAGQHRTECWYARAALPHRFCAFSSPLAASVVRRFYSLASRLSSRSRARSTRRVVVRVRAGTRQAAAFLKLMGAMSQDTIVADPIEDRAARYGQEPSPSAEQEPACFPDPSDHHLCRDYRDREPRHHVEQRDQPNDGQCARIGGREIRRESGWGANVATGKNIAPDPRPSYG